MSQSSFFFFFFESLFSVSLRCQDQDKDEQVSFCPQESGVLQKDSAARALTKRCVSQCDVGAQEGSD